MFWWCFGIAFLLSVCGFVWAQIGSSRLSPSGSPSLGLDDAVYELAFLNGGPHLTITAAAAKLHQGADADGASDLERSLLRVLREAGQTAVFDVRRQLAASVEMRRLDARLMDIGLIREQRLASLERWSITAGFALLAIVCIRFAAEADISLIIELVLDAMFVGGFVILLRGGNAHRLTPQGRTLLETRRQGCDALRTPHAHSDLPLAVALFGGGVLWHADPAFAAAWEVPREDCPTGVAAARGGCGGGTCSDGTASCSCG